MRQKLGLLVLYAAQCLRWRHILFALTCPDSLDITHFLLRLAAIPATRFPPAPQPKATALSLQALVLTPKTGALASLARAELV